MARLVLCCMAGLFGNARGTIEFFFSHNMTLLSREQLGNFLAVVPGVAEMDEFWVDLSRIPT